jgi:hypothetical protein
VKTRQTATRVKRSRLWGLAALVLVGIGGAATPPAQAQSSGRTGVEFWTPEVDLGPAEVNGRYGGVAYVVNFGGFPVSIRVDGATGPFETPDKGVSWSLKPGYYVTLHVDFVPKAVGSATGQLLVETSDLSSPFLISGLKGKGVDGDKLPDLSGFWQTGGGASITCFQATDRASVYALHAFSTKVLQGRFDGQLWTGTWSESGNPDDKGVFVFVRTGPDRLEGALGDQNGALIPNYSQVVLTRRSTFSGFWQTPPYGTLYMGRIEEKDAQALLQTGRFGPLQAPASVSWYYGKYPWSGGGEILAYTQNTYNPDHPGLDLQGRFWDLTGRKRGGLRIRADGPFPTEFAGSFWADSDGLSVAWSGKYLGPLDF